jgi:arylsulfatase A-like enzyme
MKRALVLLALLGWGCPGRQAKPTPAGKAAAPAAPGTVAAGNGWNVLLVTIDTLRADHLGCYGYRRPTSPRIDAFARRATVFDRAFTYWPKTRGSFVALLTGRTASRTGYGKTHPVLLDLNPTLASVLKAAGYETAAVVDNPNVAAGLGYAKGFDSYRETWEEKDLPTETERARAITDDGIRRLRAADAGRPLFLWLHYVNPHAPYTPPPPYDKAFLDEGARRGARLPVVAGLHGGIPKQWAVAGEDRLAYYVAQYDGEIAAVDAEVGRLLDALAASAIKDKTLVVLTSDHGESLGEHDYYFDHGEDLFDPCLRIPLLVAAPGTTGPRRADVLASTLDLVPTVLDAVKVSYPPDLAGESLLRVVEGGPGPRRERLFGQNDRNLSGSWDARYKIVATPLAERNAYALYDRDADPAELRDLAGARPDELRLARRELELFLEQSGREWARLRPVLEGKPAETAMTAEACERLRALGYTGLDGCGPG